MSVTLRQLTKSFDGKVVLQDVSYTFAERGLYLITGSSGSGKTTLLRVICGLEKVDAGTVEGGGIGQCSFAFQEHRLFPHLNALDNILLTLPRPTQEVRRRTRELLRHLDLAPEDLLKFPHELSGGMKQRISLVRALVADKPVLLLDEPAKELDPALRQKLYDLVREESEKQLVLLVTHFLDEIAHYPHTQLHLPL
ncbi:MAG: ATP-binding cassette domain-containing protein [Eubacteriales bacterium]